MFSFLNFGTYCTKSKIMESTAPARNAEYGTVCVCQCTLWRYQIPKKIDIHGYKVTHLNVTKYYFYTTRKELQIDFTLPAFTYCNMTSGNSLNIVTSLWAGRPRLDSHYCNNHNHLAGQFLTVTFIVHYRVRVWYTNWSTRTTDMLLWSR